MKGFYIEITNNLLDPKHIARMKESVWLFMWCIDAMTSISEDGVGKVLGGMPIKYEKVKKDLGIPERTYNRWVAELRKEGYINTLRTPYGLVISVNKAKKRFKKKRDTPKMVSDPPKRVESSATYGVSNKTVSKTYTKDRDSSLLRIRTDAEVRALTQV